MGPSLPLIRSARLAARYRTALLRSTALRPRPLDRPPVFILGCGRSGTTLLGEMLAKHPGAAYLYEPYHLWTAVDPRTDMTHLFHRRPASCIMGAADATSVAQRRFQTLFGRCTTRGRRLIEKTPINTLRIGYLESLAPGSRYIHIVRSGNDVARSIERLATHGSYRLWRRPWLNQWWGEGDVKWRLLLRDGAALGHHPAAALGLDSHAARGVYEWLVSLREVDRRRDDLGDRLLELRLDDLVASPEESLARIARFCDLAPDDRWIAGCLPLIDASCIERGRPIDLPASIAADFNAMQERFGFRGRARAIGGPPLRRTVAAIA